MPATNSSPSIGATNKQVSSYDKRWGLLMAFAVGALISLMPQRT